MQLALQELDFQKVFLSKTTDSFSYNKVSFQSSKLMTRQSIETITTFFLMVRKLQKVLLL